MAAPKGNQFWKAKSSFGRNPLFATGEDLYKACCEYFEWVEKHPLYEVRAFAYQGDVELKEIPKMRAMTIGGLCAFLDCNSSTWYSWRKVDELSNIVAAVENIIREQKFTGAAADLLNANIIARDLGLTDKGEMDHTSSDGSMTPTRIVRVIMKPAEQKPTEDDNG